MVGRHTRAPWRWQKFGTDWALVGAHSNIPVVLDCGQVRDVKGVRHLRTRDHETGLMRVIDSTSPDMRIVAGSPELYEGAVQALAELDNMCEGETVIGTDIVEESLTRLRKIVREIVGCAP